ncbi:LysR family transcriptional regulator [Streptomyces sp. MST-110588]|uniref:LysR family transcriptional regulator n=1 Tax=Streptomyces sp. MST-110588 TaxID=2833628 RepID=UPI001F5C2813|nr:LysR family transcriptional regulator [Streptomyces sp. MST-110588]UNO41754.1 LysR family transcriptional regulator [Streptomyces sp. MST-110588]
MPHDIDPRLLRAFTAVAEELHFTRAAARLYVAQQALSRDIRRLEHTLGTDLFTRTTRQVALTSEGARLLPYARRVLEAHDDLSAAFGPDPRRPPRPLLVDVGVPMGTAHEILEDARRAAPDIELIARYHTGLTGAAAELLAGRLDVSFGRVAGLPPEVRSRLAHQPVRYEAMAVLLPADDPLAARPAVPLDALAGRTLYAGAGNPHTAEWTDLAERLFAGRGIAVAAPFPEIDGSAEFMRVVRKHGWSVLATTEFIDVPGTVLRPITDPVPLSPVSMVWRRGLRHGGLDALRTAARARSAGNCWLERPDHGTWLPDADTQLMSESHKDDRPKKQPSRPLMHP